MESVQMHFLMKLCVRARKNCNTILMIIQDGLILSAKRTGYNEGHAYCSEMYARGYEFLPIDIYRAKAAKFSIIDGKLMPPFSSIDGMGEKAAEAVEEAAKKMVHICPKMILENRTKASKAVVDYMADLGLLGDLPESNQLSLFDL